MPGFIAQFLTFSLFLHSFMGPYSFGAKDRCAELTAEITSAEIATRSGLTAKELTDHVSQVIGRVPEFEYIREEANNDIGRSKCGSSAAPHPFSPLCKVELAKDKGLLDLQKDRFDYDFATFFQKHQDLDIVVDGTPEKAREFQEKIAGKIIPIS